MVSSSAPKLLFITVQNLSFSWYGMAYPNDFFIIAQTLCFLWYGMAYPNDILMAQQYCVLI